MSDSSPDRGSRKTDEFGGFAGRHEVVVGHGRWPFHIEHRDNTPTAPAPSYGATRTRPAISMVISMNVDARRAFHGGQRLGPASAGVDCCSTGGVVHPALRGEPDALQPVLRCLRRAGGASDDRHAKASRHAHAFRDAAQRLGIRQIVTRPRRPQTNGKVERFNRTLLEEWAYVRPYQSNEERTRLLQGWLHLYNFLVDRKPRLTRLALV